MIEPTGISQTHDVTLQMGSLPANVVGQVTVERGDSAEVVMVKLAGLLETVAKQIRTEALS